MTVAWTTGAMADLQEICDYIAQDSSAAAARVAARILAAVGRLETFPLYVIEAEKILITAVIHGKRDLGGLLIWMSERP